MTPVQRYPSAVFSTHSRSLNGRNSFNEQHQASNRVSTVFQDAINFYSDQQILSDQEVHHYSNKLKPLDSLEEYHFVEARSRFLYYKAMHDFLEFKKRKMQTQVIPLLPLLEKPPFSLDEIILTASLKIHHESLKMLYDLLKENRSNNIETPYDLITFEITARLAYHEQVYNKIQSMLSVLYQKKAFSEATSLAKLSATLLHFYTSTLLQSTENTEITPDITQVQVNLAVKKNRSEQQKRSRKKPKSIKKRECENINLASSESRALPAKKMINLQQLKKLLGLLECVVNL